MYFNSTIDILHDPSSLRVSFKRWVICWLFARTAPGKQLDLQLLLQLQICCWGSVPPAEHSRGHSACNINNMHLYIHKCIKPLQNATFFITPSHGQPHISFRADIYCHFWRVVAVMQGTDRGSRQSPHNYAVHNILMQPWFSCWCQCVVTQPQTKMGLIVPALMATLQGGIYCTAVLIKRGDNKTHHIAQFLKRGSF